MNRKTPRRIDIGFKLDCLRKSMEMSVLSCNKHQKENIKEMSIKTLLEYVHPMDRGTLESRWIAAGGEI